MPTHSIQAYMKLLYYWNYSVWNLVDNDQNTKGAEFGRLLAKVQNLADVKTLEHKW